MHNHHSELTKLDEKMDVRPNPGMVDVNESLSMHLHIDHSFTLEQIAETRESGHATAHDADHAKGRIDHVHPAHPA